MHSFLLSSSSALLTFLAGLDVIGDYSVHAVLVVPSSNPPIGAFAPIVVSVVVEGLDDSPLLVGIVYYSDERDVLALLLE